jgi:3',5'-cyclic AMP phosphodiesterase CpdA
MKTSFIRTISTVIICSLVLHMGIAAKDEVPTPHESAPVVKKQRPDGMRGKEQRKNNRDSLPMPTVSWSHASLIVARPTDTTVDINILPRKDLQGRICFRKSGEGAILESSPCEMKSGVPCVVPLTKLLPNSAYDYWVDCGALGKSPKYTFRTQRAPGSSFQFIVQGDSHPERSHQHTPALYEQSLKRVAQERPDFFIALGDDFSVDNLREITPVAVDNLYRMQREYLGFVAALAPLYLVNGNHEQAALCNLDGTPNNVAVWAQNTREKYFSQPAPGGIYTGDAEQFPYVGSLRDYYSWTWGDALFVVIDPYWHSKGAVDNKLGNREKNNDEWNSTLGQAQYQWLKQTLETSHAPFKFVFTHHVLGRGRGGVECTSRGEWGGEDRREANAFAKLRPGWPMPIHQLLAANHVTILFQGHDHLFCKQELDGVIYQTCPLPAGRPDSKENFEAYRSGTSVPGSGFVRVSVEPASVKVDFVKNLLPQDAQAGKDGDVAFSYQIKK